MASASLQIVSSGFLSPTSLHIIILSHSDKSISYLQLVFRYALLPAEHDVHMSTPVPERRTTPSRKHAALGTLTSDK